VVSFEFQRDISSKCVNQLKSGRLVSSVLDIDKDFKFVNPGRKSGSSFIFVQLIEKDSNSLQFEKESGIFSISV
jgi:hypothetical protein